MGNLLGGPTTLQEKKKMVTEYKIWGAGMTGSLLLITKLTGTVWVSIWPEVITSTIVSFGLVMVHTHLYELDYPIISHQLMFMPVSFLLVFRCSNSYGRYWEGRGLLGQLTFNTREINTKCVCYAGDPALANTIRRLSIACMKMVNLTVAAFWDKVSDPDFTWDYTSVSEHLTAEEIEHLNSLASGQPLYLLMLMRREIAEAGNEGKLSQLQCFEMSQDLASIHTVWNAMMKITSTPVPFPWMHLTKFILYGFTFTLTFPAVTAMKWVAIPFMTLISFMLFGLAAMGDEMEDPFGDDVNDFDLAKFEKNVVTDVSNLVLKTVKPSKKPDVASTGLKLNPDFQDFDRPAKRLQTSSESNSSARPEPVSNSSPRERYEGNWSYHPIAETYSAQISAEAVPPPSRENAYSSVLFELSNLKNGF
eukprot:TRINITY_DN13455_c1_g1_i1.p1 TRINITY_DN13455_c1_g1~~TRINITY_DN13455_c1_g1_i1.p1  ORF type:complete len:441 (+),score=66.51 TRINITY_DN13455_c1_g1_i1:64-1323(+)